MSPLPSSPLDENRRGFLGSAAAVLLAGVALVVPAAAGVVAFLNPWWRKKDEGDGAFRKIAPLSALPEDGAPVKFSIIATRVDAWNRFPNEPVAAVFVRRVGGGKAVKVEAFQVTCPHTGCPIGYQAAPEGGKGKFFCACHSASFDLDGRRTDAVSPSPRDMDTLEAEIRNDSEVWVKIEKFRSGTSEKVAEA